MIKVSFNHEPKGILITDSTGKEIATVYSGTFTEDISDYVINALEFKLNSVLTLVTRDLVEGKWIDRKNNLTKSGDKIIITVICFNGDEEGTDINFNLEVL